MDAERRYQEILLAAKADPDVLGFVLGGGRGKGVASEHSDYDYFIVPVEGAAERVRGRYDPLNVTEVIDGHVFTLEDLRAFGAFGSNTAWAAYGFAHLTAVFDRTGEVQAILDQKAWLPADQTSAHAELCLDALINQYYRARKNDRDGNALAARLDAAETIPLLLNVLFAREGRVRPYNKFLHWELANHPLEHLPWEVDRFLALIEVVPRDGDLAALRELFTRTRDTSAELGFRKSIAGWDGYALD